MIRLVHISDLHFGKDLEANRQAGALIGAIRNTYRFGPNQNNFLLVTGDIVHDGTTTEYELALQSALHGCAGYLLLAPGNHDYADQGTVSFTPGAVKYFDDTFMTALKVPGCYKSRHPQVRLLEDNLGTQLLTVGLNSVWKDAPPMGIAVGEIGIEQLKELDTILANPAYAEMWKLVYLHHRPESCEGPFGPLNGLRDRGALLEILRHRVDVLCFGHDGHERPMHQEPMSIQRSQDEILMLNANGSVHQRAWFEVCFEGENLTFYHRHMLLPPP